jgi:predicted HD superfamily hydrolase involved in NAD metabolism
MYHRIITDDMLSQLRQNVKQCMSQARYEHTLGVETVATYIGESLVVVDLNKIRAAALLHDVTKEYSFAKQLKICEEFGIMLRDDEKLSPAIIHSITAAAIIPSQYFDFCDSEIISCVRWHTTGKKAMSLAEKIIYLSDYIEPSRTHVACVALRNEFFSNNSNSSNNNDRLKCLDDAVIKALEQTIAHLAQKGAQVNPDTLEALSYIKAE